MQHAAFGVHLVEFYSASLRHAQAMTEHEKQQATVADFVPAALGRFNQAFNLARREMLPLANLCQHPPASVPRRSSSPCRTLRFSLFGVLIILCVGSVSGCDRNSRTDDRLIRLEVEG